MTPQQRYQTSTKGIATRRARDRSARAADLEWFRAKDRTFAHNNPGWIKAKSLRRYKLTPVRWLALFQFQGCRCAICKTAEPDQRGWAVDHDHETGEVRGILCQRCNLCLGWLGETRAVVTARIAGIRLYLK